MGQQKNKTIKEQKNAEGLLMLTPSKW